MDSNTHPPGAPEPPAIVYAFAELFEQAGFGVAMVEIGSGRILQANGRLGDICGYLPEELPALSFSDLIDPTEGSPFARLAEGGSTRDTVERLLVRKDGSRMPICLHLNRLGDAHANCVIAIVEDITERKLMTSALRDSAARLQAIFDTAAEGIVTIDEYGIIESANAAAARMFGYGDEELAGQPVSRLMPEPYLSRHDGYLERYARTGERSTIGTGRQVHGKRKDGSVFPMELSVGEAHLAGRRLYTGVVRDISERMRQEGRLRESEQRNRLLFESSPVPKWVIDLQTRAFLDVNRAATEEYGYSREEFLQMSVADIRAEEELAELDALLRLVLDGRITLPARISATHRKKDGSRIKVEVRYGEISFEGRRAGLAAVLNVTERLAAEQRLQASEERLRLAMQATGSGAFDFHPQTGELIWSDVAKQHFGLPSDAAVDYATLARGLHPDDRERVEQMIEDALRPGSGGSLATEFRTIGLEDGKERWLAAAGRVFFDSAGQPNRFVGLTRDVTERKRIEQALTEADRRKDEFLAMLSHELRNPMAAISNSLAVLGRLKLDDPVASRVQAMMERQCQHLRRLVDDLLDVTRIVSGKIVLRKVQLSLGEVLRRAVEHVRPRFDIRQQHFVFEEPTEALWVFADEVRLIQVFGNLLDNAAKYTPPEGHIELTVRREGGEAVVRVTDDGIGIDPSLLPGIFNLFTQGTHDLGGGGLGVGLTLVRQLLALHGGSVRAESAGAGAGSAFEVRLPLAQPAAAETGIGTARAFSSMKVLVVDDNEDAAESLSLLLQFLGHEVTTVYGGEQALRCIREASPQVVLLDIGMPGLNGYEVARRARQEWGPQCPILIAVTGYGQPQDKQAAAEAGFMGHLVKPVEPERLSKVMERLAEQLR